MRLGGYYGAFTLGGGASLNAGWIDGSGGATPAQRDEFVHGWSVQAGGSTPNLPGLPVGLSGQEVWGQPGRFAWSATGHEVGAVFSDPYAYATVTWMGRTPLHGPSW